MATTSTELPETELRSPTLANMIVVTGFIVLFTTFATDSPWSWIIGATMVVAGGLWAGFGGVDPDRGAQLPTSQVDAPHEPVPPAGTDQFDGTEGTEVPHGPGSAGQTAGGQGSGGHGDGHHG